MKTCTIIMLTFVASLLSATHGEHCLACDDNEPCEEATGRRLQESTAYIWNPDPQDTVEALPTSFVTLTDVDELIATVSAASAGSCAETVAGNVADDATLCAGIIGTDLNTPDACNAVITTATAPLVESSQVAACTYTTSDAGLSTLTYKLAAGMELKPSGATLAVSNFTLVLFSEGAGATINGEGLSQLFKVTNGGHVDLRHIHLKRGHAAAQGGAMEITLASANLADCTISDCTSAGNSGGIQLRTAIMHMTRTTVTGCTAVNNAGFVRLLSSSKMTITDSEITSCTSGNNGAALWVCFNSDMRVYQTTVTDNVAGGNGGAIFLTGGCRVEMTATTLSRNEADKGGGFYINSGSLKLMNSGITHSTAVRGGAGHLAGGSVEVLDNTVIVSCTAEAGGGISSGGTSVSILVSSSEIRNCDASSGTGGGALYIELGSAKVVNSVIASCNALNTNAGAFGGGGGASVYAGNLELVDSTVHNCAGIEGGAFYMDSGIVTLTRTTISECTAAAGAGFRLMGGAASMVDSTISNAHYNDTVALSYADQQGTAVNIVGGSMHMVNVELTHNDAPVLTTLSTGAKLEATGARIRHSCRTSAAASWTYTTGSNDWATTDAFNFLSGSDVQFHLLSFDAAGCSSSHIDALVNTLSDSSLALLPACPSACGANADCNRVKIFPQVQDDVLTSAQCVCTLPFLDAPGVAASAYSQTVGCLKSRRADSATEENVEILASLFKDADAIANEVRTITLKMGGDYPAAAAWTATESSDGWLTVLDQSGSFNVSSVTQSTGIQVMLNATGLAERSGAYAATVSISVDTMIDDVLSFPVSIFVGSTVSASHSVWGTVAPGHECSTVSGISSSAFNLGEENILSFTSCDADDWPVPHQLPSAEQPQQFTVTLTYAGESTNDAASLLYQSGGRYDILLTPSQKGQYEVTVLLSGVPVVTKYVQFDSCAQDGHYTTDGLACQRCPAHQVTNVAGDGCVCADAYYDSFLNALHCYGLGDNFQSEDFSPTTDTSEDSRCKPCAALSAHEEPCVICQDNAVVLAPDYSVSLSTVAKLSGSDLQEVSGPIAVFQCPLDGCVGRNANNSVAESLAGCSPGYKGPLCAVCDSDEGYVQQGSSCVDCSDLSGSATTVIGIFAIAAVAIGSVFNLVCGHDGDAHADSNMAQVIIKGKILISLFQVVVGLPATLGLLYPPMFASLLDALKVIIIDVVAVFRLDCISAMTIYSRFCLVMVLPWIGTLLVHVYARLCNMRGGKADEEDSTKRHEQNKASAYSRSLFIVFMLYPILSRTAFAMLRCQDLGDEIWHLDDFATDCTDSTHVVFTIISWISIIAYPVGIPCVWLWLLVKERESTQDRLRFLSGDYKTEHDYFEVIWLFEKLILTGLLTFLEHGTIFQAYVATGVSFCFFTLQVSAWPYITLGDNIVKMLAEAALFVTLVTSIVLRTDLAQDVWSADAYGIVLVFAVLVPVVIAIIVVMPLFCDALRNNDNKEPKNKEGPLAPNEPDLDIDIDLAKEAQNIDNNITAVDAEGPHQAAETSNP